MEQYKCISPCRFLGSESPFVILDMMSVDHVTGYGRHFVAGKIKKSNNLYLLAGKI